MIDNLTGKTFERLTVIGLSEKRAKNGGCYWVCKCRCGSERLIRGDCLKSGRLKSCGCYLAETRKTLHIKHGYAISDNVHPLYRVWQSMRERCFNHKARFFHNYGGRGITVCERWKESFENFLEDMGSAWKRGLQIDRIHNDGNYEPLNCRWSTRREQNRNKRTNVVLTIQGQDKCLADLAEEYGVRYAVLRWRLSVGWPLEKALKTPVHAHAK